MVGSAKHARQRSAVIAAFSVAVFSSSASRADPVSSATSGLEMAELCASAAERAQEFRASHRLNEAVAELRACAQSGCPKVIQADCVSWSREVDALMPTLSMRAVDSRGRDVIDVAVRIDGTKIADSLDGTSLSLDPGPHVIRLEARGGSIYEESVLVTEAQKGRVLTARFAEPLRADGHREEPPPTGGTFPTVTWVAGGVAVLGFAGFSILELSAQSEYSRYSDGCGRTNSCNEADVDALRNKFIVAGVVLGVSVIAAGIAIWTVATRGGTATTAAAGRF